MAGPYYDAEGPIPSAPDRSLRFVPANDAFGPLSCDLTSPQRPLVPTVDGMSTVAEHSAAVPSCPPVRIDVAHSEPEARAAVQVLARIWQQPDGHDPVTPELAWVFAHT